MSWSCAGTTSASKPKCPPAEYLQKYIPHSCLEGFLMGEYDRLSYMLGAVTGCNNAPEDLK